MPGPVARGWASGWIRLVGVLRLRERGAGTTAGGAGWCSCWGLCVPPGHTTARDGVIDLSGEQFSRGRVPLDGEWRGFGGPMCLPTPRWSTRRSGPCPAAGPMTGRGIAKLARDLQPGDSTARGGRALQHSHRPDLYGPKVFLDGVPVTGSGSSPTSTRRVPSLEPRVELPWHHRDRAAGVGVQRFHSHRGGLPWSWSIGPADDVVRATVRAAVVSGVTAFMGVMSVLFLLMWVAERRGTQKLWFAAARRGQPAQLVGGDARLVYLLFPSAVIGPTCSSAVLLDFWAHVALTLLSGMFPRSCPVDRGHPGLRHADGGVVVFLPSYWLEQLVPLRGSAGVCSYGGMFVLTGRRCPTRPRLACCWYCRGVTAAAFVPWWPAVGALGAGVVGAGFIVLVFAEAYALARIVSTPPGGWSGCRPKSSRPTTTCWMCMPRSCSSVGFSGCSAARRLPRSAATT